VHIMSLIQTSNCVEKDRQDGIFIDTKPSSPYFSNKQLPFSTENDVPSTKHFTN